MRDDGDFLSDLRAEIAATQSRRHQLVLTKLVLAAGFLGAGFAFGATSSTAGRVLLVVPALAFVFDLCIMAEAFAIRRMGKFIALNEGVPPLEASWEHGLGRARDRFGDYAAPLSSALVFAAAAIGAFAFSPLALAIPCGVAGAALVVIAFLIPGKQAKLLEKLTPSMRPRRPRRKKRKAARKTTSGAKQAELNGEMEKAVYQPLLPL